MNINSFVQIDDSLAFNPGYITRVRFGYERTTICRVTVSFVDGVSITLADEHLASFLEWWTQRAIVRPQQTNVTKYYGVFVGFAPIPFAAFAFKGDAKNYAARYKTMNVRECYVADPVSDTAGPFIVKVESDESGNKIECKGKTHEQNL